MTKHVIATRPVKLRDIPLLRRLTEQVAVLDSEFGCTRDVGEPSGALLTALLLPQRSLHTLVSFSPEQPVVGQFRLKTDDHLAQIVYIAPRLEVDASDTSWLHILDALAAEAGRRGAYILTGEVDENSQLFQTMRTAGFAVYARQELWRHAPGAFPEHITPAELHPETDADAMDIQLLYSNIVPRLVQPIAVPSSESSGWVYRQGERIQGYIAVSEGKSGIYLLPYLHPDILFKEAAGVLAAAIAHVARADKVPVYICVRRYQDWLEEALTELGFESCAQQAVMVRHIAAGVRLASFAPLNHALEVAPRPVRPPTSRIVEPVVEVTPTTE